MKSSLYFVYLVYQKHLKDLRNQNINGVPVKTLRVSDDVHQKLTALLGELVAQTSKMQTYQDAIEAMLYQSVILPPELLREVEEFVEKNRHRGYTRREEFIRQAIRFFLRWESEEYEYFELPREKYERLRKAIKALGMPYTTPWEFVEDQIDKVLEQYEKYCGDRGNEHDSNG